MTLDPYLRGCGSKRRYGPLEAWAVAHRIQGQEQHEARRVKAPLPPPGQGPWPYWCAVCDGYHVGHERTP